MAGRPSKAKGGRPDAIAEAAEEAAGLVGRLGEDLRRLSASEVRNAARGGVGGSARLRERALKSFYDAGAAIDRLLGFCFSDAEIAVAKRPVEDESLMGQVSRLVGVAQERAGEAGEAMRLAATYMEVAGHACESPRARGLLAEASDLAHGSSTFAGLAARVAGAAFEEEAQGQGKQG